MFQMHFFMQSSNNIGGIITLILQTGKLPIKVLNNIAEIRT